MTSMRATLPRLLRRASAQPDEVLIAYGVLGDRPRPSRI